MKDALQVLKFSIRDLWEEFVLLVVLNLVWSLTAALPILALFLLKTPDPIWVLVVSLLLLIPLPVISGALCFVTNQISRGKAVGWREFPIGLRRYWGKSLVVGLINVVALVLIATNLQFYGIVLEGTWTTLAVGLWLILGVYWLLVQIFWFPMILELESERILLALRNALAMAIVTPGFTLALAVILVVVLALSIALTIPLFLFMVSLILLMCNHATRSRLALAKREEYEPRAMPD